MKIQLFLALAALLWLCGCSPDSSAPDGDAPALTQAPEFVDGWHLDWGAAKAEAKARGMLLFALFTGSDWCPWCVKLEEEVLSTDAFRAYARENLVLFKADFLESPTAVSEAWKQQNEGVASSLQVKGFPTIVLFAPAGGEVARMGYVPGGAKAFLAELAKCLR